MDWGDVRYFLAVARTGTLASAGRELGVEATTVGRRLQAFEAGLGARLFDRTTDGFVLTIAGERILAHARAIEAEAAELERKAIGDDARLEGVVRLATSENLAVALLVRWLAPICERHPGIEVEVITGSRPVDLLKREADIAVRAGPGMRPTQANLLVKRLGRVGFAAYASEAYIARSPPFEEGFAGHAALVYGAEIADIPPAAWLAEHGGQARVAMRLNSMLGLAQAVVAGAGVAVLPCFLGDTLPDVRRVRAADAAGTDVWRVVHPDLVRAARVRAVLDFLDGCFAERQDVLTGGS